MKLEEGGTARGEAVKTTRSDALTTHGTKTECASLMVKDLIFKLLLNSTRPHRIPPCLFHVLDLIVPGISIESRCE